MQESGHGVSGEKPHPGDKNTEYTPPPTIYLDATKKTGAYGVSDSKEKKEEQHGLRLVGNRNAEEDAAEERTGDYAKPDAMELQLADQVPDSNGEINCHFGILREKVREPVHKRSLCSGVTQREPGTNQESPQDSKRTRTMPQMVSRVFPTA